MTRIWQENDRETVNQSTYGSDQQQLFLATGETDHRPNGTQSSGDVEVGCIGWTSELETGIDVLDEQHHRYVDLLGDYFEKVSRYKAVEEETDQLTAAFDFLRKYAEEHFATEESIMTEIEYPDYSSHLKEHVYFLNHVEALYNEMNTKGFSPELSREVNYYTVEWFIEHILLADMKLVNFMKVKH